MNINGYRFGCIEVEGSAYNSDVIITPEGVADGWWRKQGHELAIGDLDKVVAAHPEVVVIGSGCYGRMQVPQATRRFLEEKGIRVEVATTADAVNTFNRLQKESARVVAALHLTC
jgi:hypothetical protein